MPGFLNIEEEKMGPDPRLFADLINKGKYSYVAFWKKVYLASAGSNLIPEACNKAATEAVQYLKEFEKGGEGES